jgi:hypothetical protein
LRSWPLEHCQRVLNLGVCEAYRQLASIWLCAHGAAIGTSRMNPREHSMWHSTGMTQRLDPSPQLPVEILNEFGSSPVVPLCEHASNFIRLDYEGLGLCPAELERHIAWDIGAGGVTRRLVVAIHSFTPTFHGEARPWDAGIIYDKAATFAERHSIDCERSVLRSRWARTCPIP